MHKAISVAGAVHRRTFARFFGQGAFFPFFRTYIPKVNIIRPCVLYKQIASGNIKLTSLFGFRIEFRQLNIKRRKCATTHSAGFYTFVGQRVLYRRASEQ
ncbi:MAG: hypothetical protein LBR26_13820 [Prevotella sp.]|jgi:hypothetical protein|nr:hypothetical protein [Prevotella sp.]